MGTAAIRTIPTHLDPASAARLLTDYGFLAISDLPDRPGPAYLMVALREAPTLHHYDPEAVEYWVTESGRGARRTLTRDTPLPIETAFSWGLIRIVDRLHVTNEYLTFGGRLSAQIVDGVAIAVFNSPAPLLRRGGHSQDGTRVPRRSAPSSVGSCSPSTSRRGSRVGRRRPIRSLGTRRSSPTRWPGIGQARCCATNNPACGRCSRLRSAACRRTTRASGQVAKPSGSKPSADSG